ncbi:unnamed protein product [Malus baccata var. baccata]
MVAFGKKLRESQIQEWQGYYLDYKLMKKKLNQYTQQIEVGTQNHPHVLKDFSRLLDSEIEKIVMFMLEQQGVLASRLSSLGEQYESLIQQDADGERISQLQEAYRSVGRDLLRILSFVEMNAIGLRKILKKFDKRFGYKFTDYYVKTRANHPYSQLRQVCKHVDPVVNSLRAAVNRLSNSTSFLHYLGKHALLMEEDLPILSGDQADDSKYHFMSLILNLANTFLYMVNTYIIVPTADNYSMTLGAAATVCGVVIGSMAVAHERGSLVHWVRPFFILLVGNTLYALAYDLNSISVLLIGRLFCGLGSARAVNRRYISDCVPLKLRMQASAGFVSAGALGMACGPALACLFQRNFKIYKLTFNEDTLPGWVMALAWLIYLLWLSISFKEPSRAPEVPRESNSGKYVNISVENGSTQPFLTNSKAKEKLEDRDTDGEDAEEDAVQIQKPVNSIVSAYRLLSPSVKVQLYIYFMLKYAMEIVLAESSVITGYYFVWSTSSVAAFLACLGLTVLPVNVVIGSYVSNMFEERQVLLVSEILVCIGILLSFHVLIPYSMAQYVSSALLTFVAAEVLEGVNLSLLSRVMSSRLSRGTYNGGLLSTEAGTLARVIADGTITISGALGQSKLLNTTLVPALFICVTSIVATCFTYNSLY